MPDIRGGRARMRRPRTARSGFPAAASAAPVAPGSLTRRRPQASYRHHRLEFQPRVVVLVSRRPQPDIDRLAVRQDELHPFAVEQTQSLGVRLLDPDGPGLVDWEFVVVG